MFLTERKINDLNTESFGTVKLNLKRITALWAFSEAAFGGILHALKVPLTGLFIGGAAVIFIYLIAYTSNDRREILKSTLIVILVKAIVSPHTPIAAFFAVILQGTLGYLFFSFIKHEKTAVMLLSIFTMLFSALQKLILITILFGNTIWESIDLFAGYVFEQFGIFPDNQFLSISYLIILFYITIHLAAGLIIGMRITELPGWLKKEYGYVDSDYILTIYTEDYFNRMDKRKKKRWWTKPTGILILGLSTALIVISYTSPGFDNNTSYRIIFMLIRFVVIMLVWFSIISPFISKHFTRFIEKNKFKHAGEINQITALFPNFKKIINYSWKESSALKGYERIKRFSLNSFALLLTVEIKNGSN